MRARRTFRRRRRTKWDMQTFRDCERVLGLDVDEATSRPCNDPLIFADYLCGVGPSTAGIQNAPGASRAIMYGGGHLHYSYHVAIFNSSDMPCPFAPKVVTAVVKLPLLEDDLTPAYLPNLHIARSQLSVVPSTESDEDEDILFWNERQLFANNIACDGCNGAGCTPGADGCATGTDAIPFNQLFAINSQASNWYGRQEFDTRIKVRRRIREREALFLLTEFIWGQLACAGARTWPILRTVYHRYAVRQSR